MEEIFPYRRLLVYFFLCLAYKFLMYVIDWQKKARKQLDKIADHHAKVEIKDAVGTLVDLPNAKQVKKLTNHRYDYRLRVGRYRVFFDVAETIRIVSIEEVKKRDDRTY